MEKLKVNNYMVEVNYPEELEPYMDRFEKLRIRGEKIQACSPFRQDKHPSFAVNLDNGSWVDSGADNESGRKGSFITLLAYFRGESYEDTALYLLEKYSHFLDDAETLKLDINLQLEEPEVAVLSQEQYADMVCKPSGYLLSRGITMKAQKYFQTGESAERGCVALPWHDVNGRIINVKYRSTTGKQFWFAKGGQPIKQHLYGLFAVVKHQYKEVWCVESEIDALYLWSNGIPAVAFGGASINETQRLLLLNSGVESLVIATDADAVGTRFREVLCETFAGYLEISYIKFPKGKKDVNDLNIGEIGYCSSNKTKVGLIINID